MVAVPDAPELQVPPVVPSNNAVVDPAHTLVVPVIAAGEVSTVIVMVVKQPLLTV